jgi:hypothetical protein
VQVSLRWSFFCLKNANTAMHQFFKARPRLLMGLIACAALAACGGGDGQDDSMAQNEGETRANALETTTTTSWKWIANEWNKFSVSSQRTVRYGITGKWVQKTVAAGTYSCTNTFFGKDPAPGSTKRCEVYTSTTTTTPTTAAASLAWNASSGVTGYRLYYGTAPHTYQQAKGSGVAVGNVTAYKVSGLKSSTLYYFAVTAVDSNGQESAYSNEVSKQTP